MKYPTFREKIVCEIERQNVIESMDITETILKKFIEDVQKQNCYAKDIKHVYFYPVSNNYFCRSFAVGFSFTSTVFEHEAVIEGTTTAYLVPVGKHGDCSREVISSVIEQLRKRLEEEGLETEDYLENGFCVEIKI